MAPNDIIDIFRVLNLRPACVRAHLFEDEETLPLSPGVLLPPLGAPLLEVPAVLGALLDPCLRAASGKDAPLCVGLDGEAGPEVPGPRGFHAGVDAVLAAARGAAFRLPLVIHARLGLLDGDDTNAVDAARIKVLEAIDAGVSSVQLGVFGDPEDAARLLSDVLRPVADNGLGVVVQLADSYQAQTLPELLSALEVHAYATPVASVAPRRDAIAARPVAPFPAWADASNVITQSVRTALKAGADASLGAMVAGADQAARDRLEARLFGEVEDLLVALGARGSAGRAMVALSQPDEAWPDPE